MRIKLKEILEEEGVSVYWLAKECEVTYKSMYNLVNNNTTSTKFYLIERICKALKITPNDMFDMEND